MWKHEIDENQVNLPNEFASEIQKFGFSVISGNLGRVIPPRQILKTKL